jgi:REP element-mobilizing transposase RayT
MELNTIYFYTVAIVDWIPLLESDKFKNIVLDSLIYLVKKKKLKVYGFVIMPNHIHIIWEAIEKNGKEMPQASFMKFTGHKFLEELKKNDSSLLSRFKVDDGARDYQFWQKKGQSTFLFNREILEQKLDYTHYNPLQEHWNLANNPNEYYYSSCTFYELGDTKFDWLTHYMEAFGW